MSNIRDLTKKMKEQSARIAELSENVENEVLSQQAQEFTVAVDLALESVALRDDVSNDIVRDCADVFEAQDAILQSMFDSGNLIEVALSSDVQRPELEAYNSMVERIENMVPKYQEIVEGMAKSNTYLTTINVRPENVSNKLDESVVRETTERFEKAGKYIKGLKGLFGSVGPRVISMGKRLHNSVNGLNESIVKEDHIKGDYYCVVQPNYAIFGVGKTAEEAWNETEEWADTTDENWKDSFVEMRCSEKLYNEVSKNGTPDKWEEYNGIAVLPEELDELEEAVKASKV